MFLNSKAGFGSSFRMKRCLLVRLAVVALAALPEGASALITPHGNSYPLKGYQPTLPATGTAGKEWGNVGFM